MTAPKIRHYSTAPLNIIFILFLSVRTSAVWTDREDSDLPNM